MIREGGARGRWLAGVVLVTALAALAALVPPTGGVVVGGTPQIAESAGAVLSFARLLTGALLLAFAPGATRTDVAAAAAAFALTGAASFAGAALVAFAPEAVLPGGVPAETLEFTARALLPVGLALAVTLPWERVPVRSLPAAAFLINAAALVFVGAALLAIEAIGSERAVSLVDPGASHVVVAAAAAVAIAVAGRPAPLWRWALIVAVVSVAAASTRLATVPLTLGWYVSLTLSLAGSGVVLVGVVLHVSRGLRDTAVAQERRGFEGRLERMALYDDVTGLPNERHARQRIDEAVGGGGQAAAVLLALDGLGDVLDAFGQQRVDDLLRAATGRLGTSLAPLGTLNRVGDEELALLLQGAPRDLLAVAGLAIRVLEEPFDIGGIALSVGAVAGCARAPRDGDNGELLLRRAGLAARAARRQERQALEYAEGLESHRPDEIVLLSELRPGIARGELTLFYQAKARVRDRVVVGAEALVRWRHPQRGLIPPSDFIPLAERSDVISALTRWVMNAAAERAFAWRREGLALQVAVNVPARTIADRELPAQVKHVLDRSGVDPASLRIEVTESGAMTDIAHTVRQLHALRDLGVSLSVDDFGTGYSSLAYLARLPIDEVKIDRSFVRAIRADAAAATIVRTAVELCHQLGYTATAEGAEDEDTWAALADMGTDAVQGYVVSRPLPPDELITHLRASGWVLPE